MGRFDSSRVEAECGVVQCGRVKGCRVGAHAKYERKVHLVWIATDVMRPGTGPPFGTEGSVVQIDCLDQNHRQMARVSGPFCCTDLCNCREIRRLLSVSR